MAFTKIIFKNPNTGAIKEAPVGFSWTVFFFGFIPALFRADWKWAAIMFLLAMFTFGLSNLVFMFIYNKLYVRDAQRNQRRAVPPGTEEGPGRGRRL